MTFDKKFDNRIEMNKFNFLPNAEAYEVRPREQIVSTQKDANIGHCNILEKKINGDKNCRKM